MIAAKDGGQHLGLEQAATLPRGQSMIRKRGYRFSEGIMLHQSTKAAIDSI
jgi:hypothetical protein